MPSTRIEVKKGYTKEFLSKLMTITHNSMVEVLQIPAEDRNQRLIEIEPEFFFAKPPYEFFIEIKMFKGRTAKLKAKLFKTIVDKLNQELNIDKNHIFIIINDIELENWGVRGGIQASDLNLSIKKE